MPGLVHALAFQGIGLAVSVVSEVGDDDVGVGLGIAGAGGGVLELGVGQVAGVFGLAVDPRLGVPLQVAHGLVNRLPVGVQHVAPPEHLRFDADALGGAEREIPTRPVLQFLLAGLLVRADPAQLPLLDETAFPDFPDLAREDGLHALPRDLLALDAGDFGARALPLRG